MKHFAIIADGNRRWAKKNNLPSELGYVQGLVCIENLCTYLIERNIKHLSVFCFSTENWQRTEKEVNYLLGLARDYFIDKKEWYYNNGIKVVFRGGKNKFPDDVAASMLNVEEYTKECTNLTLYIMADYGGKSDIVEAITAGAKTEEEITTYFNCYAPDPDVIVRTGGRKRLSNFMLWQAAYAELFFIDTLFPDFSEKELDSILNEYKNTQQNYGK